MYKATVKSLPKGIDAVEYKGKRFELDQEVEITNSEKDELEALANYTFSFSDVEGGSKKASSKKSEAKSSSAGTENVDGDIPLTLPDVDAAADTLSTTT